MDKANNSTFPQKLNQLRKIITNNKKYFVGALIVLLLLVLCIISLTLLANKKRINSEESDILVKTENKQVFFPYVPNFDKLTIDDIPNISDIIGIFNYNDNLIIATVGTVIEYNPKTQTIIRQLDTNSVPCSYDATKIDSYLYLDCNGSLNSKDLFYDKTTASYVGIYVINLSSGVLQKKYLPNKLNFDNVSLASMGKTLWIGAYNGVAKVDTIDDTITTYNQKQLGFSGTCGSYEIHTNDINVWVNTQPSDVCSDGISIYSTNNNTWKSYWNSNKNNSTALTAFTIAYSKDKIYTSRGSGAKEQVSVYDPQKSSWNTLPNPLIEQDVALYRDRYMPGARYLWSGGSGSKDFSYLDTKLNKPIDFTWNIPDYLGLSNKVSNKYYLLTKNSIYTLKKNEFPKLSKFISPLSNELSDETDPGKLLVDNNEKYLFFLVAKYYQDGHDIRAELIDITNGNEWNLINNNPSYSKLSDNDLQTIDENISYDKYIYKTNDNGIDVFDSKTKKLVMQLDFTSHSLNFK